MEHNYSVSKARQSLNETKQSSEMLIGQAKFNLVRLQPTVTVFFNYMYSISIGHSHLNECRQREKRNSDFAFSDLSFSLPFLICSGYSVFVWYVSQTYSIFIIFNVLYPSFSTRHSTHPLIIQYTPNYIALKLAQLFSFQYCLFWHILYFKLHTCTTFSRFHFDACCCFISILCQVLILILIT